MENLNNQNELIERTFGPNEQIMIPSDVAFFETSDSLVAVSPSIARWLVLTHGSSILFFRLLCQRKTINEAISHVKMQFGASEAERAMNEVLGEILDKEFEMGASVQPDLTPSPYAILSLNITNACNLCCITCYRFSGKPDDDELPEADWISIVREHASLGGKVIKICGGEPLYRSKDLVYNIIRTAKDNDIRVLLLSNGCLIDKEVVKELVDAGLDRIQISLDGPDRDTNDRIRGRGVYEKVMQALRHLCGSGIHVYLAMLPIPEISLEAFKKRGVEFADSLRHQFGSDLTISISQGILDGREVSHEHSLPHVNTCRKLQDDMGDSKTTAGLDLWQWEPGRMNLSCGYGRTFAVEPNGSVRACAGSDSIGNIKEAKLSELRCKLESIAINYMVDMIEECQGCSLRYVCGGPCRVRPEVCTDDKKQHILGRLIRSNALRYDLNPNG